MTAPTPTTLNCPACGAPLEYTEGTAVIRCRYCGNVSLLPGALPERTAASPGALNEIRRLALGGNLIEAIKKYRQVYGADLAEARQAVEALQAGRLAAPPEPGMPPAEELTKVIHEVQRLLLDGKKLDAIKIYRENYDVSLARARYAIEQIESGQTLNLEAGFETIRAAVGPVADSTRKRRGWIPWVVFLSSLLFVAGFLYLILFQPGGPFIPHYFPGDASVLLARGQAASPDFALSFYDSNAENRFIGLLNAESGKLTWKAAPLAGDGFVDALAAGSNLVYAASGTDLLAYRLGDGTLAWQAKMTDKLNYADSALLVTPVRVITNNADQTLQAYNADNGSPVWSKRLSGYDRGLHPLGGSLMVIDYVGDNNTYGLIFLDQFSGDQQNAILPTCTYNNYDATIDPDSGFVYDPAGNALYIVYDSSYGCVQRLDASTGQVVWSTAVGDSFNFMPAGFQYLLTDSTLYFSLGNRLMAVDKSTGEMKTLASDPDYDLLPLAVSGDKLLARARRTRGTEKFELWGLNAASGASLWKIDLQAAQPIDPPDSMAGLVDKTAWGWTWNLTASRLTLIRFQGEPNQVNLEFYDPASGANVGNQILPLKNLTGDFYDIPKRIGTQGGLLYYNIDQGIYSLDLAAVKLKHIY